MVSHLFCIFPGVPVWSLKTQADEKHSSWNCRFCIPSGFVFVFLFLIIQDWWLQPLNTSVSR